MAFRLLEMEQECMGADMKIGFVGLGSMGSAMAANLLKAGHEVTVWNRSPGKSDRLVANGARQASDPSGAANGDLVITMLANDAAVEQVVFGSGGILAAKGPAVHASMSTISLELADRLAQTHSEAGWGYVSAPVFGRPAAAEAGQLFIAAAGPADAVALCEPAFAAMGQRVFRLGEKPSAANIIKLCGNFMIQAAIEAMAEAMTLCQKNGVEKASLLEVLTGTLFNAPAYQIYGQILIEERFRPAGFAAPLGLKDMTLVAAAATSARVPMPVLGIVRDHLLEALAHEGDDIDWSAIAGAVTRSAGL
jgi:3-hydroxyisobutyrate dehydrogenase-like beta-hydroxyacid dehydrogenase